MEIFRKQIGKNQTPQTSPEGTGSRKMEGTNKLFYERDNIGMAKYTVLTHNGIDKHPDGSPFYGIGIFRSKKARQAFIKKLKIEGYKER